MWPEPTDPGRGAAALAEHGDRAAALAATGLTPDPRRGFVHRVVCGTCKGAGTVGAYSGDLTEWEDNAYTCGHCHCSGDEPDSPVDDVPDEAHVIALGDRVDAVTEVEGFAWELVDRLGALGCAVTRLAWQVGRPRNTGWYLVPYPVTAATSTVPSRLLGKDDFEVVKPVYAIKGEGDSPLSMTGHGGNLAQHARWQEVTRRGLRYPDADELPKIYKTLAGNPAAGKPFTELRNPYTPLLHIWRAGFGVDYIDDTIKLRVHAK